MNSSLIVFIGMMVLVLFWTVFLLAARRRPSTRQLLDQTISGQITWSALKSWDTHNRANYYAVSKEGVWLLVREAELGSQWTPYYRLTLYRNFDTMCVDYAMTKARYSWESQADSNGAPLVGGESAIARIWQAIESRT